jgi:hypothetical protein
MAKRVCACCGKEKDVAGGRICENGHFICYHCVHETDAFLSTGGRAKCPVCKSKLK